MSGCSHGLWNCLCVGIYVWSWVDKHFMLYFIYFARVRKLLLWNQPSFHSKTFYSLSFKKGNFFWAWKDDSVGKHEDLSLDFQYPLGPAACIHRSVVSALGRWTQWSLGTHWVANQVKTVIPRFSEGNPVPKNGVENHWGRNLMLTYGLQIHVQTHGHVTTYTCVHICSDIYHICSYIYTTYAHMACTRMHTNLLKD